MTNYILCTSPRSGSTLLCDLLWQTGVAGKPNSFFRPQSIPNWCDHWGLPPTTLEDFDQTYLAAVLAEGEAGTGTFGLRIMHDNLGGMLERLKTLMGQPDDLTALTEALGPLKFLHLKRADKVAQAVSLTIAEQTGLWHKRADGTDLENFHLAAEPVYDRAQIAKELASLEAETAGWPAWFAANDIRPHRIDYDDLSQDPIVTLAGILRFLDKDPDAANSATPGTQKLASVLNTEWARRFRKETGLPPAPLAP